MSEQLSILNVVRYQYNGASAGPKAPKHKHYDIFHIFYVLEGTAHYIVDEQDYIIEKDQFIFVMPLSTHELKPGICDNYTVLDFKFTINDRHIIEGLKGAEVFYGNQGKFKDLFTLISDEVNNTDILFDKVIYSLLEAIVYLLSRANHAIPKTQTDVIYIDQERLGPCAKKVLDVLEGTSIASVCSSRIDEIAKIVGYNKQYMCKTFAAEIGISLTKFQQLLKIDKAKEMLESTNFSVGEIANLLGYSSQSHFIKIFKENTGSTPLQYRRMGAKISRKVKYTSEKKRGASET